jgi:hypothetical protein
MKKKFPANTNNMKNVMNLSSITEAELDVGVDVGVDVDVDVLDPLTDLNESSKTLVALFLNESSSFFLVLSSIIGSLSSISFLLTETNFATSPGESSLEISFSTSDNSRENTKVGKIAREANNKFENFILIKCFKININLYFFNFLLNLEKLNNNKQ